MQGIGKLKYILFLGLIITLLSCGLNKEYHAEKVDLPEEYQLPDSISINLDTVLIPRNEFFKDSVLIALIDHAFANNFDLLLTEKDIAIDEKYLKEAKAAFFPTINLNLFNIDRRWYSRNSRNSPSSDYYAHKGVENPPENLFVYRSDYYTPLALNWEVDIWGKLRKQRETAAELYQQSKIVRRVIETELIASIAEDYYTLLMLDEQLDVAEKNHKFRDSTLTMINLLYNSGEVTALAVQQAQTQVLDASSLISELKEERTRRENDLRLLTGELPGNIERGFKMLVEDSIYEDVKELPLYLVKNRPDILVAQHKLSAANAFVGVRQAERLPSLSISLEGGLESLLPQNWFNIPGSLYGHVLASATQPIFQGRRLKTNYEVAMLERDQAEIEFQRKVYEAVVDIENSLSSLKRLEEQLVIADVKQMISQRALESSRMLFQSGFANYLEVITTQSEALDAELSLVRIKARLLTERIQLYRALGGGWR